MANANLFQQYLQPVRSVADYAADMDKAESNKLALLGQRRQNELAALTADQTRQTMADSAADRNALQSLAKTWGAGTSIEDRVAALRNSGRPSLMTQADALEKQGLEKTKTGAQAAKDQAEADAKQAEIKWKLADRHAQQLSFVRTPQDAVAYVDEGIREGTFPAEGRERALTLIQQMGVDKWKAAAAQAAVPVLERYKQEADTLRTKMNNDTSIKTTAMNNATTQRGQNMADSRAREANNNAREASATVYDPERGILVNKGTGLARPAATFDGKPVGAKDKPLAEGAQKQLVGTRNLQDAVGNYLGKLQGWGNASMLSPDKRAEMGNAYNNMMLQAKEAYNLGVLNGPDYDILQSVVKDPTKITSAITSNDALKGQATELSRIAKGIENRVLEAHGRPTSPAAQAPMSHQDTQAAEWAKANPSDPRAVKIKQRLGL